MRPRGDELNLEIRNPKRIASILRCASRAKISWMPKLLRRRPHDMRLQGSS